MKTEEIERLEEMLKGGIAEFTYLNRNGDREHYMRATSTPLHLMFRPRPKETHLTFYDMDAEKWRRCRKDHVTGIHNFWPWDSNIRINLEPMFINVVTPAPKEEPKPESRLVKFFENVWSAIREIVSRPEKTEYEIYLPGQPTPYDEAEIEDMEYEEIG